MHGCVVPGAAYVSMKPTRIVPNWPKTLLSKGSRVLTTVDAHTCGEPLRIVVDGGPEIVGETMLDRRRYVADHFDDLRKMLMWEPRGHHEMYGCLLTAPVSEEADFGVLFMHNQGYSTMCGHGVIALVTALVQSDAQGVTDRAVTITLDTPAGLIRAVAECNELGEVLRVRFTNVSSFVFASDLDIDVPGYGTIRADIAFGGAFYVIADARQFGVNVDRSTLRPLIDIGAALTSAVNQVLSVTHPEKEDLSFLYGSILVGEPQQPQHHSSNICIFADGEVDRSPTGTGVSARLAILHAKGELRLKEAIVVESILGAEAHFVGRVVGTGMVGPFASVTPEISGRAFVTGMHQFVADPRDNLAGGFLL